jgi:hypothetical protein
MNDEDLEICVFGDTLRSIGKLIEEKEAADKRDRAWKELTKLTPNAWGSWISSDEVVAIREKDAAYRELDTIVARIEDIPYMVSLIQRYPDDSFAAAHALRDHLMGKEKG